MKTPPPKRIDSQNQSKLKDARTSIAYFAENFQSKKQLEVEHFSTNALQTHQPLTYTTQNGIHTKAAKPSNAT